jgi:hypothetical protein
MRAMARDDFFLMCLRWRAALHTCPEEEQGGVDFLFICLRYRSGFVCADLCVR